MITAPDEYQVTIVRAAQFAEAVARLEATSDPGARHRTGVAGARAQLAQLERELAMWGAGIREGVPGEPDVAGLDLTPEQHDALSDTDRAAFSRGTAAAQKRGEVANIDRQVGIVLDRIADWRRHRAWLEREIAELDALPAGADPVGSAAIDTDPVPIEEATRAG